MTLNFNGDMYKNFAKTSACPVCKHPVDYDLMQLYHHMTTKCKVTFKTILLNNNKILYSDSPSVMVVPEDSYIAIVFPNTSEKTVDIAAFTNKENLKDYFLEIYSINSQTGCTHMVRVPILTEWDKLTPDHVGRYPRCIFTKYPTELTVVRTQKLSNFLNNWIIYNKIVNTGISASVNDSEIIIKNQTITSSQNIYSTGTGNNNSISTGIDFGSNSSNSSNSSNISIPKFGVCF